MSEKNDNAVVAVFGQVAVDKAAQAFKSAVSSYGAVTKQVRAVYQAMIDGSGKQAADINPEDRAEFVVMAGEASGVDYKPMVASGLMARVAKEMGFPMVDKGNGGSGNVFKFNAKTGDEKEFAKMIKAVVKAMVKNGADKAVVVAAVQAAVADKAVVKAAVAK